MAVSQSLLSLNVRTPSTKALLALGILPLQEGEQKTSRGQSRPTDRDKSSRAKGINRHQSNKTIITTSKDGLVTSRQNRGPDHQRVGSQTERSLNVVNNFNVKINEEMPNEKMTYEIADLKLNLQMKTFEASTLSQTVKTLKKTNRKLEQDHLQLKQELEEMTDKLSKSQQNLEYFKSLSQLKSDELVNLNSKMSQLKKQVSSLASDDNYHQSISNWSTSLMKVIADAKQDSSVHHSLSNPVVGDQSPITKNKEQLKKLILEIEVSGKAFTGEAVCFLADFIDQDSVGPIKDQGQVVNQAGFASKIAFLLNSYREVIREDFVTRRELHKTTASIHQHYVTRMNARQQETSSQMASLEKTLSKYRKLLASRVEDDGEDAERESDDRTLANYIDPTELDFLRSHDIEGVSLIYKRDSK